uniref:class I SAM-dependent methyltransferase n=1 Tax=Polymorphobacter sp. TaxID=1909290 RepID=UPI003F7063DB
MSAHSMLARSTADEMARQRFVLALKRHVMGSLRPGAGLAYRKQGEPAYIAAHGRPPETRAEAEEALDNTSHYRFTKSINRASQEMMWQSVGETVYREKDRMEAEAARLIADPAKRGSLTLDPAFTPEKIYEDCFIHLQPEGYCPPDPDGDSIIAGAFYESGGRLYSMGRGMAGSDSKAGALIKWLAGERPGWQPRRMLDMGCSAGGASVEYPVAYPDCEVHACDIGASMLRYAHSRAEAIGVPVHFHQADAGNTGFPDGHFDLIVSHNLFHEISGKTRRRVAAESLRLLAPGGICIHQDVDLLFRDKAPWEEAERAYDLNYNNEPFWLEYATCDFRAELVAAGFP